MSQEHGCSCHAHLRNFIATRPLSAEKRPLSGSHAQNYSTTTAVPAAVTMSMEPP